MYEPLFRPITPADPTGTASLPALVSGSGADPDLVLSVPEGDVEDPELSIVVPALNEQLTIGDFIDWCQEGLRKAGVRGEILIVDSSTDETGEIALAKGARVLKIAKARPRARVHRQPAVHPRASTSSWATATAPTTSASSSRSSTKFREGAEFVMGSRFRGYIEPGAMPPLHRYLGTPVTTWILNVIFSSHFSDIHCGMRGITRAALERMGLRSQSWEYASEMVLKSVHMKLKTDEVPIRFLKDHEGRLSHHKRSGWFSPWAAAWINLRAMFIYGAAFFLYRPGFVLAALGVALTAAAVVRAAHVGPITFSLHWMLLGLTLATLGLQCIYLGILAQSLLRLLGRDHEAAGSRASRTRARCVIAAGLFAVGSRSYRLAARVLRAPRASCSRPDRPR